MKQFNQFAFNPRVAGLEKEINSLTDQLAKAKKNWHICQNRLDNNTDMTEKYNELFRDYNKLVTNRNSVRNEYIKVEKERNDLQSEVDKLAIEKVALQEKISQLEDDVEEWRNEGWAGIDTHNMSYEEWAKREHADKIEKAAKEKLDKEHAEQEKAVRDKQNAQSDEVKKAFMDPDNTKSGKQIIDEILAKENDNTKK